MDMVPSVRAISPVLCEKDGVRKEFLGENVLKSHNDLVT